MIKRWTIKILIKNQKLEKKVLKIEMDPKNMKERGSRKNCV